MLDELAERDEQLKRVREQQRRTIEHARPKPIGETLPLALPMPTRLLTNEQAQARDARSAVSNGREQRLQNLRRSGIGRHLGIGDTPRIVRDQLSNTEALQLVRGWAMPERDTARRWMLIAGERGIGKTIAAGWLIARDGGRYVTMLDLVEMYGPVLRGLAPQTQDETHKRLNALAQCKTLVLDELGRDGPSPEVSREALHWLVEMRQSAKEGRTLVLSNKSAVELRKRFADGTYDSRTESRLRPLLARRKDGGAIFEITGKDMRGEPI